VGDQLEGFKADVVQSLIIEDEVPSALATSQWTEGDIVGHHNGIRRLTFGEHVNGGVLLT
jgi:hypothetical protein